MGATEARLAWAADITEIRQLACRYAISADSKNPAMMASCYADPCERSGRGERMTRAEVQAHFAKAFAFVPMMILHLGNHLIEIDPDNPDRATGTVYSRCEAEAGETWLIQQIVYHDVYVRQDGGWRFWSRKHLLFYGTDLRVPPIGLPPSDAAELSDGKGSMPQYWPSYRDFYQAHPDLKHY
jgi:hypothetical protein